MASMHYNASDDSTEMEDMSSTLNSPKKRKSAKGQRSVSINPVGSVIHSSVTSNPQKDRVCLMAGCD